MRVIDTHLNTKNWIPKITIEIDTELGYLIKKTLINGELHGPFVGWYDNGQLEVECEYLFGELHGPYKKWYSNGQPLVECEYLFGEFHGLYKEWYINGRNRVEVNYEIKKDSKKWEKLTLGAFH
jgi:antitoxin component YwqK of YwqJK toxin-antitoxin module